jgi:hypothetical protein
MTYRPLHIFLALAAVGAAPMGLADDTSKATPAVPVSTAGTSPPDAQSKPEPHTSAAQPVCFKLTLHCVGGTGTASAKSTDHPPATTTSQGPTEATKASPGVGKAPAPDRPPLNLAAPDVRTVVAADELSEPLPELDQDAAAQEADTVQVQAGPDGPEVPSGFASIWWAVVHPTQAWRILSPAQ